MSDLKLKTKGIKRPDTDLKDYAITCAEYPDAFMCINDGRSRFTCPAAGVTEPQQLKEIKMAIAVMVENGQGQVAQAEADGAEAAADILSSTAPTWDAVHPCALLIQLMQKSFGLMGPDGTVFDGIHHETLNCYGWLLEDGKADLARAAREIARKTNQTVP